MPITSDVKKNMPCNIIEIMWYIIAEFNINCVHIIAYSGVFVNDLRFVYKESSMCIKKIHSKADRFYKTYNDRS